MDVEMRTAFATRMGLPLGGGNQHIHHPMALPPGLHHFYPHLPAGIHQDPHHGSSSSGGEYSGSGSPESPAFIHKQMQLLEQSGHHHLLMAAGSVYTGGPITDAQVIFFCEFPYKVMKGVLCLFYYLLFFFFKWAIIIINSVGKELELLLLPQSRVIDPFDSPFT